MGVRMIFKINSINEKRCVYWEVENGFSHIVEMNSTSQPSVAQTVRRQPFTAVAQVRARSRPDGNSGKQTGTATSLSVSLSVSLRVLFPLVISSV